MLVFLDGIYSDKDDPDESYAREMMELFSLGAGRGAYTETDVREMARPLTGWTAEWTQSSGLQNLRFDPSRHDEENETVFGQTGNWNHEDAVRLVRHPSAPCLVLRQQAGGVREQTFELRPGSYSLFCSLPEHEQKGMKATLVVD